MPRSCSAVRRLQRQQLSKTEPPSTTCHTAGGVASGAVWLLIAAAAAAAASRAKCAAQEFESTTATANRNTAIGMSRICWRIIYACFSALANRWWILYIMLHISEWLISHASRIHNETKYNTNELYENTQAHIVIRQLSDTFSCFVFGIPWAAFCMHSRKWARTQKKLQHRSSLPFVFPEHRNIAGVHVTEQRIIMAISSSCDRQTRNR